MEQETRKWCAVVTSPVGEQGWFLVGRCITGGRNIGEAAGGRCCGRERSRGYGVLAGWEGLATLQEGGFVGRLSLRAMLTPAPRNSTERGAARARKSRGVKCWGHIPRLRTQSRFSPPELGVRGMASSRGRGGKMAKLEKDERGAVGWSQGDGVNGRNRVDTRRRIKMLHGRQALGAKYIL